MVAEKVHEVTRLLQQYDDMQLELSDLKTEKGYDVSVKTNSAVVYFVKYICLLFLVK
jgi:hypothetical protein